MKFSASMETHKDVHENLWVVAREVRTFLNEKLQSGNYAASDVEVLYVPIIMPAELAKQYPERSRIRHSTRTASCCPRLDYQVFLSGSSDEHLFEYLRGLENVVPMIAKLEGNDVLSSQFNSLICQCYDVCTEKLHKSGSHDAA